MNARERQKILKSTTAVGIRRFLESFIQDADLLPRRSEAIRTLEELLPDRTGVDLAPVRKALLTKAEQIAAKAQDRSARFELRGQTLTTVIKAAQDLDKLDRVVQIPAPEELDYGAVADQAAPRDEELDAINAELEEANNRARFVRHNSR